MSERNITVRINTVGDSIEVEVPQESTVADATAAAGVDPAAQGLNTRVNGADASPDTPVSDGDQVNATPRNAKLG